MISYAIGRCVYASLVCTFRHGREEDEVMGISFQKELIVDRVQVFPASTDKEKNKMQVRLPWPLWTPIFFYSLKQTFYRYLEWVTYLEK